MTAGPSDSLPLPWGHAAHFDRLARERGLAVRAVARGTVPDERMAPVAVDRWDEIPPMSADYAAARDAIVTRVEALLDELEAAQR